MVIAFKMTYDARNDAVASRWTRFQKTLKRKDFIRPLKLVAVEMYVELDRTFSKEASPDGKKWPRIGALTDAGAGKSRYAIFKKMAGKGKLLVFEGIFRKAFLSKSGTNSVFKLTRTQVTVGSKDVRANALHFGISKRNIPPRNIVGVTKKFENTIVLPIFKEFLQRGWIG